MTLVAAGGLGVRRRHLLVLKLRLGLVELGLGILRENEARMRNGGRLRMRIGDDHRRPNMRDGEKQFGKFERQSHAAMRRRIARQLAGMKCHARPGQPVHVRHRRVVIGRGMVIAILLQDREHAGRRRMAGFAGRTGRDRNADAIAIDMHQLIGQRDDDGDRPLGRTLGMPGELSRLQFADFFHQLREAHARGPMPQGKPKSGASKA